MTQPHSRPAGPPDQEVGEHVGTWVEDVNVAVDFEIIQHFSNHLYASPYKALEELVTNGFDAGASEVRTYIPSGQGKEHVIVWDDGLSMNQEDLHRLWWIARSPKRETPREIRAPSGGMRKVIGKFGIGKLASYAVGRTVFHLCKRDGRILLVGLDYAIIEETETPMPVHPIGMYDLSPSQARSWLEERLDPAAEAFGVLWDLPTWTIAVVSDLHPNVNLQMGRLRWLLGNGMPLRPDFAVYVEDAAVSPKVLTKSLRTFSFGDADVRANLQKLWAEGVESGEVTGEPNYPGAPASDGIVELPCLGAVTAKGDVFAHSLVSEAGDADPTSGLLDVGRMHGFFIMVRDRLINPADPRFFLPEPSYGTFNRMHIRLDVDGLDDELLADREHVRSDLPRSRELTIVQRALYSVARLELEKDAARRPKWEVTSDLLPIDVGDLFREPLSSFLAEYGERNEPYTEAFSGKLVRENLGADRSLADIDSSRGFVLNIDHPFYAKFGSNVGSAKEKRERLSRMMEILAIADTVTQGWMLDLGVPADAVAEIAAKRDAFFKAVAVRANYRNLNAIFSEVETTSRLGDEPFETALARLFEHLGFVATRRGETGAPDVLVLAPIGLHDVAFIIEAKGSKGTIGTREAKISAALSHQRDVGATFAIVVARDFEGKDKGENGGVFKECNATDGRVVIWETQALVQLAHAAENYSLGLNEVVDLLRQQMHPTQRLDALERLQEPARSFALREVLDYIWEVQQHQARGALVPLDWVFLEMKTRLGADVLGVSTLTEFKTRMKALDTLTDLLTVKATTIQMTQNPERVLASIENSAQRQLQASTDR